MPLEEHTHYDLLGVPRTASTEQIRRAYREKMKETHPDQFSAKLFEAHATGDEALIAAVRHEIARAEEQSKRVNQAYETLSDSAKRRRYDLELWQAEVRARRSNTSTYTQPSSTRTQSSGAPSYTSSGRQSSRARPRPTAQARTTAQSQQQRSSTPTVGWGFLIVIVITFARMLATNLDGPPRPDEPADGPPILATFVTIEPTLDAAFTSLLEHPGATPTTGRIDVSEWVYVDENGQEVTIILGGARRQPTADVAEIDAEVYYERGLDHLAKSSTVNDMNEQMAVSAFIQAMLIDTDHRLAIRMLGQIYFDRWQANQIESDSNYALRYLSRYVELIESPVDAEVRQMLDTLE